jgi:integrase
MGTIVGKEETVHKVMPLHTAWEMVRDASRVSTLPRFPAAKLRLACRDHSILLHEYLQQWVKKYKTGTGSDYQSLIRSYINPGLGDYRLNELTRKIIEDWVNDLKAIRNTGGDGRSLELAVTTKRRVLRCLHKALADAELEKNPADGVEVYSDGEEEERIHPFSPDELAVILADENPFQDLYRFAVETGDRRNEVIAEQRRDFVLLDGRYCLWVARSYSTYRKGFKIPKNKDKRLIDLFPGTVEIIQRRLTIPGGPEDLIFPGKDGRPIYPTTITHAFQDLLKKLGIKGHCFHDLRHTCATYLLNNHWSVAEVARRLGHRDASVTARVYANWLPGQAGQLIKAKPDIFGAQSCSTVFEAKKGLKEAMVGDSRFELETPVLSVMKAKSSDWRASLLLFYLKLNIALMLFPVTG